MSSPGPDRPTADAASGVDPQALLPYGLLLPALLAPARALGYPLVRQVVLSLPGVRPGPAVRPAAEWVGLDNYREVLDDPYLWLLVLRSVVFCLVCAGITMLIGPRSPWRCG